MRISDWSSDVCSSDLIRIRPGRTDQRADLTNPGIPAIGGERAELRIEFLGLQPVIAARGDDHGRFLEIEGFIEPKVDRAGDPAFDQIGGLRSEEHTSELQSLMRISYAVFCLKTKKKKEKTNITAHIT